MQISPTPSRPERSAPAPHRAPAAPLPAAATTATTSHTVAAPVWGDQQDALTQSLFSALGSYLARLRPAPNPPPAPKANSMLDSWHKSMLQERIEMLRKLMALAGNDQGSLRALAQQLSQVARELKALSGNGGGALPVTTMPPAQAEAAAGNANTEAAGTENMGAPSASTVPDSAQEKDAKAPPASDSGQASPSAPGAKATTASTDTELEQMLLAVKRIRDWLRQQARAHPHPDTEQALQEIDRNIAALEHG